MCLAVAKWTLHSSGKVLWGRATVTTDFEGFTAADLVKVDREDESDLDLDWHEIEDNVRNFSSDLDADGETERPSVERFTDCHVPETERAWVRCLCKLEAAEADWVT